MLTLTGLVSLLLSLSRSRNVAPLRNVKWVDSELTVTNTTPPQQQYMFNGQFPWQHG